MVKFTVDNGEVGLKMPNDMKEIIRAVTLIVRTIGNCEELSESDRSAFKDFVREELGKVAFMSLEELKEETKRLKKKMFEELMENDDLMHDILKAVFK